GRRHVQPVSVLQVLIGECGSSVASGRLGVVGRCMVSKVGKVVVAVVFAVLIFAPAALWISGWQSEEIENRALSEPPEIASPGDLVDEETYAETSEFLVDHMPLREEAVQSYGRVNMELFDESPNPDVALGEDD